MAALLRFFGFDRAVAYSLVLKLWQAGAGLIGILLITQNLSPEVQGFYYTFASLVALQTFVELGLYLVILNTASHEWAKLQLGEDGHIEGDLDALSRLVSLGRFVFKWYAVAVFIFLLLAGVGGYLFLGQSPSLGVNWQMPWFIHIGFSSLLLWCMPFLSLLEGCDQVAPVARFRFWQAFVSSLAFWAALVAGFGLWAAPVLSMVSVLFCMYHLLVSRRVFFKPFFTPPVHGSVAWRTEIFPMQWRLALQGLMNYFGFAIFTPVMFYYYGPAVAGQMGMSQQIAMAMLSISLIWVTTKAPRFGMLVARREFHTLDVEWRKASLLSVSIMLCGVLVIFIAMALLNELRWEPLNRLLSPGPFLMLGLGTVFATAVQCVAMYLRAHKKEVLTAIGTISGALIGLMVWALGAAYGPAGATGSYLFVMSCVVFPMASFMWQKSRRDWHR